MKTYSLFKLLVAGCSLAIASVASAVTVGINPSSPLSGYDLGGGQFATLVGLQSSNDLVGETVTVGDLYAAINSGTVSGFYYASGNAASAMFDNIVPFAPFTSDLVVAGGGNPARVWDSLYAIHTGTVVFSNGLGNNGTTTMGIGGTRISGQNPFARVPDSGATAILLGATLAAVGLLRRRMRA